MKKVMVTLSELIVLILLGTAVCYAVYGGQAAVKRYDVSGCGQDGENITVTLDEVREESGYLVISGWVIYNGRDSGFFDSWVLLRSEESGEYFRIATALQERTDVTEVLGEGVYDYDTSGFYAQAETKRLGKGTYEICLLYNVHSDNIIQHTGTMVTVGQ